MEPDTLDSRFLFPNPLTCLGDFLVHFSERSPFPVAVRSIADKIQDEKILLHNKASAAVWGKRYEDKGIEGMKLSDFVDLLPSYAQQLAPMSKADQEAIENETQSTHIQHIVYPTGFVQVFQRVTSPIYGQRKKLVAMSTMSLELTQYTNLLYLLDLYKQHHPKKSNAVAKISAYLALEKFFIDPLTYGECLVLFAMEQLCQYKQIAALLTLSLSTVTSLVDSMRDKLKPNFELSFVVSSLRTSRRWQPTQ